MEGLQAAAAKWLGLAVGGGLLGGGALTVVQPVQTQFLPTLEDPARPTTLQSGQASLSFRAAKDFGGWVSLAYGDVPAATAFMGTAAGPLRAQARGDGTLQVDSSIGSGSLTIRTDGDSGCFAFEWPGLGAGVAEPADACLLLDGHWYGGPETYHQDWPMTNAFLPDQPFVSNDIFAHRTTLGSVAQPVWTSSRGVLLDATASTGLNMSMNTAHDRVAPSVGKLCLRSREALRFRLCAAGDVVAATRMYYASLPRMPHAPDTDLFRAPIWSTWAQFKMNVTQQKVLQFAKDIVSRGFPRSILEIDDKWSPAYGDLEFDTTKFPDAAAMVKELHQSGFKVTLWVMPFVNPDSLAFKEGVKGGYLMRNATGQLALLPWWQGVGAVLNVTNPDAVRWFTDRLHRLMHVYGIDGFKFDAGEDIYVPPGTLPPHEFTKAWVTLASSFDIAEVRSSYGTQDRKIWVREFDKDSAWSVENGLQALITSALHFGQLGYPFVLPDMIGGNAYGDGFFGALPSKELYIRWAEANALLPAMQFSIAPWQYDNETVRASLAAAVLHESYSGTLERAAAASLATGEPLVRPMFWADPLDPVTHTIADQFLVGDTLLVAPVVEPGVLKRNIYLPQGLWQAISSNGTKQDIWGPRWLRDFPAPLCGTPPLFQLLSPSV